MVDREAFDELMAALDAPMAVVTAAAGRDRAGCLVGFHSQSSIGPGRYAVWLSKANHTYRVALHAPRVAVHLLTDADRDLAELFGGRTGDEVDKFRLCEWTEGPDGVPLLDRCGHRLVARRRTVLDDDDCDHVLLVLVPDEAWSDGPFRPLRLSDVRDVAPGHDAEERPVAPSERSV